MSQVQINDFTQYQMRPEEVMAGQTLNMLQEMVIQNEIGKHAQEKILIEFDPQNPLKFAQQEAYKRGAIDALRYMLECSALIKTGQQGV